MEAPSSSESEQLQVPASQTPSAKSRKLQRARAPNQQEMYKHFERLLNKNSNLPKQGDRVVGTVISLDQKNAYIDIGAKTAAVLPKEEMSIAKIDKTTDVLVPDMQREFLVLRDDYARNKSGEVILSLKRIEEEVVWSRLLQMKTEDVTVDARCVAVNRGGALVKVHGLDGFCPASQLPMNTNLEDVVGSNLRVKFLEADPETGRMVFSARRAQIFKQIGALSIGEVVEGRIQAVKPYGAFVDLGGGLSGLLHISEISHDRIQNVDSVLGEGDLIKAIILEQDPVRSRTALSTKKLEPTPGDMLRNPKKVFDMAEEMAADFRKRMAEAENSARDVTGSYDQAYAAPAALS
eukprot:jgi/Astpho2/3811/Aster-04338